MPNIATVRHPLLALALLFVGVMAALSGCSRPVEAPLPTSDLRSAAETAVAQALPTATSSPSPDLDATIEARVAATMAAMLPTPIPAHAPEPLPVPTTLPTPTSTAVPTPKPTPNPVSTPNPIPESRLGSPLFVQDSSQELFCFSPCSEKGQLIPLGHYLADLSVEVTFINPTQTSRFEYGVLIRDKVDIKVHSGRFWNVNGWTGDTHLVEVFVKSGPLDGPFNTDPSAENHLRITAVGDEGCIFVNEEFVSCFDISAYPVAGRISVASKRGDVRYRGVIVRPVLAPGATAVPTATPTPIPTPTPVPTPAPRPFLPPTQVDFDQYQVMESEASRALERIATVDAEFATRLRGELWVVERRNYPALVSLGELAYYSNTKVILKKLVNHTSFEDGISAREAMILATANYTAVDILNREGDEISRPAIIGALLDPEQTDLEVRTITLPLAGEVDLAIIRPHPLDACKKDFAMDTVERSVRTIEEFMGVPFPVRPVVFLFTDTTGGGVRHDTFIQLHMGEGKECGRLSFSVSLENALTGLIAHETAHHYWFKGPDWLFESAAEFMGFLVQDKLHLTVEEVEALWLQAQGQSCTLVGTIAEFEALGKPEHWDWNYADCQYSQGRRLLHDLYRNMDDVTFRQAFRRLYLATQDAIPNDDVACQKAVFAGHYGCVVKEAFQTYAPQGEWPAFKEIFDRHYGSIH